MVPKQFGTWYSKFGIEKKTDSFSPQTPDLFFISVTMSLFLFLFVSIACIAFFFRSKKEMFLSESRMKPWLWVYWWLKYLLLAILFFVSVYDVMDVGDASDVPHSDSLVFLVDVSSSMNVVDVGLGNELVLRKALARERIQEFVVANP